MDKADDVTVSVVVFVVEVVVDFSVSICVVEASFDTTSGVFVTVEVCFDEVVVSTFCGVGWVVDVLVVGGLVVEVLVEVVVDAVVIPFWVASAGQFELQMLQAVTHLGSLLHWDLTSWNYF